MNFLRKYFKSLLVYGFIVSGISAIAEWSSFWVMSFPMQMHYVIASIIAFVIGTSVNALLSRLVAFDSKGRSGTEETMLIYATSALAFLLNLAALIAVVQTFESTAMVASLDASLHLAPGTVVQMTGKVLGTAVAFFANYFLRQFYIFSSEPRWK